MNILKILAIPLLSLLALFILMLFFLPETIVPGDKTCSVNEDCIPVGMNTYGCYSDPPQYYAGFFFFREAGAPPPENCFCVENVCQTEEGI